MNTTTHDYTVTWTDGELVIHCTSLDQAYEAIRSRYPDASIGHDGDLSDGGDRTLAWESAEDAEDDAGENAVAEVRSA